MKKDKRMRMWGFLITLFVWLLVPTVRAEATTLSLTGDDAISSGTTVKYRIEINSDASSPLTSFDATVNYDSKALNFTAIELGNGWTGTTVGGTSGKEISFKSSGGGSGRFVVATLVFTVAANPSSNNPYIKLTGATTSYPSSSEEDDGVSQTVPLSDVTKNLRIKSTDNTLSDLKINNETIDGFASNKYEYDVSIDSDVSSARIAATTNSSLATLKNGSGNRTVSLNYGNNVVNVIVISESGTERVYKINITREDTRSSDATLASITVDGNPIPNFKSSTYRYKMKKYKMTSVKIVATTSDEKAKFEIKEPKKIVVGENNYVITVTSEKGDTATYTIVIDNIENDINKKLKTLSVKGYNIGFDRNNNRYEISYDKSKFKNLHIYYTLMASSDEATAVMTPDINNDREALSKLRVGDEISIKITGIDGESIEYTIVVVKDNRISFFLIFELLLMLIVVIAIIVIYVKRKNVKNGKKKNNYKTTKVVDKGSKRTKVEETTSPDSAVPIVTEKKSKKKRFSIYEDEYEEVEVEVDDDDEDYSETKEYNDNELH